MGEGGGEGGQRAGGGWNVRGVVARARGGPWGHWEAAVLGLGGGLPWPCASHLCRRTHGCNTKSHTHPGLRTAQTVIGIGQAGSEY